MLSNPCYQIRRISSSLKTLSKLSGHSSNMVDNTSKTVNHDSKNCHFSINLGNEEKAMLYYEKRKGNIYEITHTFVPETCRGQGLAGMLMKVQIFEHSQQISMF